MYDVTTPRDCLSVAIGHVMFSSVFDSGMTSGDGTSMGAVLIHKHKHTLSDPVCTRPVTCIRWNDSRHVPASAVRALIQSLGAFPSEFSLITRSSYTVYGCKSVTV